MAAEPKVDEGGRESASKGGPGKARRALPMALVVLGGLLTFLAVFSIWINRQVLNTDNWVNTSTELLQNEDVRGRLSEYLSEQIFANVDVKQELEGALPPRLAPLAAPAAAGLQSAAPQLIERVLGAPRFQAVWETANRAAHETLLKVLDGGGKAVSTEGGEVTLKLRPALESVGERVGIGGNLASKLPADAGELTILKSEQLSLAQNAAKLVRKLPIVLTLLALLCFVLAVWLAPPAGRRRNLRAVGFAIAGAGLVVLVLRHFAGDYLVGALAQVKAGEPAVAAVWSIGTSLLVTVAVSALTLGLLLVLGAFLAGSTRPAVATRRLVAPYADNRAAFYGGAALVFLLLLAWAPIAALSKPLGVLIFALLFGAGTELWRRQALAEFPDQPKPELRLPKWRPGTSHGAPPSQAGELEKLATLHDRGALSDAEFERAKAGVLGGSASGAG
jgi:hypothetical protein